MSGLAEVNPIPGLGPDGSVDHISNTGNSPNVTTIIVHADGSTTTTITAPNGTVLSMVTTAKTGHVPAPVDGAHNGPSDGSAGSMGVVDVKL
jgi:hypothetical protein